MTTDDVAHDAMHMPRAAAAGAVLLALLGAPMANADERSDDRSPVAGWTLSPTEGFHPRPRDSASAFDMPGSGTFGIFGGYREALDISGTTGPTTHQFLDELLVFDAATRTWSRRSAGRGPTPRGFACAAYEAASESVLVFGGTRFEADFSAFTYFDDLWRYDLSSDEWTQVRPSGPKPSARAGFGCDVIGDKLYVFSGNGEGFATDNELWRYDARAGSWTLLQVNDPHDPSRPVARTQMIFTRIPGRDAFLMVGGDAFKRIPEPPFLVARTQTDVWMYDADANTWKELAAQRSPEPARNHRASAMISARLLLVQSGDAQSGATVDDTCPPPLVCLIPATPTRDTFVYDIERERWSELRLPDTVPPTRRSTMRIVGDTAFLFGGYGWDGENAVGKISNPYTWELDLGALLGDEERDPSWKRATRPGHASVTRLESSGRLRSTAIVASGEAP